ncbi:hypothetical protein R50912_23785 [Paenibacillus sp. FSL R5-0912]|nr:hypothetical protein R50912_23785 [Paenibacillus sp. FSL R5-0912]
MNSKSLEKGKSTIEINKKRKGAKGKFGTVGAIAYAFVPGYQPLTAVEIEDIWGQQRPEVQMFTAVTNKL